MLGIRRTTMLRQGEGLFAFGLVIAATVPAWAGAGGNGHSFEPALSAGGRFVAFWSCADNLVPGDTNGFIDVFVRGRQTGTTRRVSIGPGGVQANGRSNSPTISADGRFVAFFSGASNLVPGDTNGSDDIFVRDRQRGATEQVSMGLHDAQPPFCEPF
jgi:Tol biopolymer transport system component